MMVHAYNPSSTQETENMMEVWLTYRVPVLQELQNKTFFNKLK